ncbi:Predicted methyltransferase (contains TPR repeat) [Delftia tsuruhatensis]|uniref:tetratricopeptide repeat protein n=1 Tax=Delftia tsuruhatensis TaxID=180282 RepID=UPI001E7A55E7|nr:tetratricopeptide repeat protein [Delftia tsuruhatensis]CAB5691619.1 Predicted methyltransferase (contains TPR repeat) [Delftia tsuruhatensis]CAC9676862.1 Predicted methyltransferase (contains TPR repeat) [Delftia tsuruhatensis]
MLGSMAQARSAPGASARAAQAEAPQAQEQAGAQARAEADESRAALQAAEDAYARGDWLGASRQFKQLTSIYPNNAQLWFGYGASAALSGDLAEAAAGFEAALRIDGNDARAAYNLGLVRLSQADMAINRAGLSMANAPAQVREEISRLRSDLAPLFGRNVQGALASPARPEAVARVQDPARAAARTVAPSEAQIQLPRPGLQAAP